MPNLNILLAILFQMTMSKVLPRTKSIRHISFSLSTQRSEQNIPNVANLTFVNIPYFDLIIDQCSKCLTISYKKYVENGIGRDREGTWVDQRELQYVLDLLTDLRPTQDSKVNQFIASSPLPIYAKLWVSTQFDMTLLHAPSTTKFPPRRHTAGTILLYRNLYGNGNIRTFINSREIKYDVLEDTQLTRLGGPSRVFGSEDVGPAAMLEIALHPPRREDEGLSCIGGFESSSNILQLDITKEEISTMFGKIKFIL